MTNKSTNRSFDVGLKDHNIQVKKKYYPSLLYAGGVEVAETEPPPPSSFLMKPSASPAFEAAVAMVSPMLSNI